MCKKIVIEQIMKVVNDSIGGQTVFQSRGKAVFLLMLFLLFSFAATGNAAPSLTNGGFETPDVDGWAARPSGSGWSAENNGFKIADTGSAYGNTAYAGSQNAILQNAVTLSQSVSGFVVGKTYTVSWYEADRSSPYGGNDFRVLIDTTVVYSTHTASSTSWAGKTSSQFVASSTTHTLKFEALNTGGGDKSVFIDAVSFNDLGYIIDLYNGGFEIPDVSGWAARPSGSGWSAENNGFKIADSGSAYGNTAYAGSQNAILQGDVTLSQSVSGFEVGEDYEVSWYEADRASPYGGNDFRVLLDSTVVYSTHTASSTSWAGKTSSSFEATSTTHTLKFDALNTGGGDKAVFIDSISIDKVESSAPGQASNPSPANSATSVSTSADLSWTAGSGATSHNVYFGEDSTPDSGEYEGNQSGTTFDPGTMDEDTTYYWRIDEVNSYGTTTGTVWSFTTSSGGITVSNPGWETPNVDGYEYRPSGSSWSWEGNGYIVADTGSAWGGTAYAGSQYCVLQREVIISQSISGFEVGHYYSVSWYEANRSSGGGNDLRVLIDGTVVGELHVISNTSWVGKTSYVFEATSTTHTLEFEAVNTAGGDRSFFLDSVSIEETSQVPDITISNPGWESPNVSGYQYTPSGSSWSWDGNGYVVADSGSVWGGTAYAGSQHCVLQGTVSIYQEINDFVIGKKYQASWAEADRASAGGNNLRVWIDNTAINSLHVVSNSSWVVNTSDVFEATSGTHTLEFEAFNVSGGDRSLFLDSVSIDDVSDTTAPKWEMYEVILRSTGSPSNPFTDTTLTASVTPPGESSFTIDGFYDGNGNGGQNGNIWKLRFSPDKLGTWTWTTTSNDSSLNGKSGSFTCVASSDPGPIVANGRYFEYADGDPVYLIGNFLETSQPTYEEFTHTILSEESTETHRQKMIARHRDFHNANKMNIYIANDGDYGDISTTPWLGTDSSNNKSRFDLLRWKMYDRIVKQLLDEGMIAELWFFADDSGFGDMSNSDRQRLIKYAMARLSAYPHTMFVLVLEWQEGWSTSEVDTNMTYGQNHNPWGRLWSIHGVTGNFSFPNYSWADFMATQSGNDIEPPANNSHTITNRNLAAKPLIVEEFGMLDSTYSTRLRGNLWTCFCGGAAGSGTGSDLPRLRKFIEDLGVEFWNMAPNNSVTSRGYALVNSGEEYVVYVVDDTTFSVTLPSGSYYAEWFNPRQTAGNAGPIEIGTRSGGSQNFTPPTDEDWVLHIIEQ